MEDRTEGIRAQLTAHHREAIDALLRDLERIPPRPYGKGYVSIEYAMPGSVVYYMGDGETILYPLQLSEEIGSVRDEIKVHLGTENWNRWESLQVKVNSHLDAVLEVWKEIESSIATQARRAGLFPSNTPADAPVDTYWPALFVATIWRESEYHDANKVHSWEGARVVENTAVIPMRHTVDAVQTFVVAGTNLLRSQSIESAEMMKKAWEAEGKKVEPIARHLMSQRTAVVAEAAELREILRKLGLGLDGTDASST